MIGKAPTEELLFLRDKALLDAPRLREHARELRSRSKKLITSSVNINHTADELARRLIVLSEALTTAEQLSLVLETTLANLLTPHPIPATDALEDSLPQNRALAVSATPRKTFLKFRHVESLCNHSRDASGSQDYNDKSKP